MTYIVAFLRSQSNFILQTMFNFYIIIYYKLISSLEKCTNQLPGVLGYSGLGTFLGKEFVPWIMKWYLYWTLEASITN